MEDRLRASNICLIGVPTKENEGPHSAEKFEELRVEIFPYLKKT